MGNYSTLSKRKNLQVFIILVTFVLVIVSTYLIYTLGSTIGFVVFASIIGIAIGIYSLLNYEFGFYFCLGLGFVIFFLGRIIGEWFPIGVIVDIQILLTFLGLLIHKITRRDSIFKYSNHIISYVYLFYLSFLILQIFNPNMFSIAGWFLIVRKFLQFLLVYILGLNLFTNIQKIDFFFRFIIIISTLTGLYGCYQEWFGLFQFETDWIFSDSKRVGLYMLYDGTFRIFSTLSDPAAFGITMASCFLLVLIIAINLKNRAHKYFHLLACIFMLLGVAYSGTRTSYFVITVGILLYIMMTISNRRTLIFAGIFSALFVLIVWGPIYGNTTINRIRSTFEFSKDGSLEVRDINRKNIQPYIYSHPIGGGLATSGAQGMQYNPGHELAGFPPDSGYIKAAIETGWVGFLFQCLIYFIILRSGVHGYYSSNNQRFKTYYLAILVCLFSFIIAQYSQEAIAQIPSFFLFYSSLALIVRLKQISTEKTDQFNKLSV